ncbi:GNAT family N-acetyltransferase [Mameliella sediminis]|uniref:GNAT family N-acetyltransferase n=1 Tax=Mameliella sediminis TaxID=2836866 RepID=UPI001C43C04B|nr:GNAT family N-acetyltransferase [Mameliella sediminis]MBV7395014.1 GNAT family N-acetyltransferase [Mameliella sediminis]MBY6159790.1 GNAT family N-acetyltransferase [Mameliella alba]MBY6168261.1 GNAT family N-acetyltransferase [Mameliella alba]MBY6173282.1 GNAT family N-acetyltransferase [Mameliella alba]
MSRVEVTEDLAACHALRRAVFIDEQGISEAEEWDDLDDQATHLLIRDGTRPVATARLLRDGATGKIGRICVLSDFRGHGYGKDLVRYGIGVFSTDVAISKVRLSAQEHALPFYAALGFVAEGDSYDDAGIPHRDMVRDV